MNDPHLTEKDGEIKCYFVIRVIVIVTPALETDVYIARLLNCNKHLMAQCDCCNTLQ